MPELRTKISNWRERRRRRVIDALNLIVSQGRNIDGLTKALAYQAEFAARPAPRCTRCQSLEIHPYGSWQTWWECDTCGAWLTASNVSAKPEAFSVAPSVPETGAP